MKPLVDSAEASWEDAPTLALEVPADPLADLFHSASLLVLKHPVAAQAAFFALITEGRRFAATPEGQRWRTALASSEFVRRGRALWETSLLNLLEDDAEAVLPASLKELIVWAASRPISFGHFSTRSLPMPEATVHRHRDVYDDRNAFLLVLLGAISLDRRFERVLVDQGPSPVAVAEPFGEDRFLNAALGLVAVARQVSAAAEMAAAESSEPRPAFDAHRRGPLD